MEKRPMPEDILARLKAEESSRGTLKIFFGAAAGVGKTYAMLDAARHLKKEGADVVVGYAETHGRVETEALLEGLEILPSATVSYKNVKLREFDIDAALQRNPKIILVDELAHTNVPGSRHPKRWQDVEELLDKGIDVYTTLNVQHCESVNDIVTQVTGVTVKETVPDTFVEKAHDIELVDTPTDDLLSRLKQGKVYLGEMGETAAQNFFQVGNLIALRELALRYTERNVNVRLMDYRQEHAISKTWNVRDRFLVAIRLNREAISLIRAGKRIAADMGVEWFVVAVEPPHGYSDNEKRIFSSLMQFAEKLGAKTAILSGQDMAETLVDYARSKNITFILIGKPITSKFTTFFRGSLIEDLARKCGEIDLYILSGDKKEGSSEDSLAVPYNPPPPPFQWADFIKTIGVVALCTLIDAVLFRLGFAIVNLIMVYLLGVTWTAFRYNRRMSIPASFLSVLCFDFFFIPPYLTFAVEDAQYILTFIMMLIVALTISSLAARLKFQTKTMRMREDRLQSLYDFSRDLSKSSFPDELFQIALIHIRNFFRCRAVIFKLVQGELIPRFGEASPEDLNLNEYAVMRWTFEHKKITGKGTDTLPGSNGLYLPLVGPEKTLGVIGIFGFGENQFTDPDQMHMLETLVTQTAVAVEGAELAATHHTISKK
jgi:two-component system, OmpR family, sensor histidine kinase KdpD